MLLVFLQLHATPRPQHLSLCTHKKMEEENQWNGIENNIDDPEELQVIYRTLDSYQ
jgi:hypothetical protein